jgi:hypothetical protein
LSFANTTGAKEVLGVNCNCMESFSFRYSVFNDNTCSCENIIKANEESSDKCNRKCRNADDLLCGGDGTESFYETGSKLPGSVGNLRMKEATGDKITIEFDPPERNSSFELTGMGRCKRFQQVSDWLLFFRI